MNKLYYQVLGIGSICLGSLAIFGSIDPIDQYGLFGGALFVATGIAVMQLLSQLNK